MRGVVMVVEVNTYKPSSESEIEICTFPLFYKSYFARLLYRRSLYIYMWKQYQQRKFDMYPGHVEIFKYIRQMLYFTDEVVMKCVSEAEEAKADTNWIPIHLREWLIIEFKVGSHNKESAEQWIRRHRDDISVMDPTEFGMYNLLFYNIYLLF